MLIQKDYIIVDLVPDCGNRYLPSGNIKHSVFNVEEMNGTLERISTEIPPPDELSVGGKVGALDFTIQVNGKLKKHRTFFEIQDVKGTEELPPHKDLVRWEGVQEAISMLSSLGYELDIFEIQKKIHNQLNSMGETD